MKLWLDDVRTPPGEWAPVSTLFGDARAMLDSDTWIWATTAKEAIGVLGTGLVTECSLDHDLASEHYAAASGYMGAPSFREMAGYDVVIWMAEHNVWPEVVRVHSMNPTGAEAMRKLIERHKP